MTAVSWLDGRWLTHRQARVSVDDRAFLFADGVYEVVSVYRGQFVDADLHLARLRRSLAGLSMRLPLSQAALSVLARELIRRNAIAHGMLYLQVTRGAAPRWHGFPDPAVKSTLLLTAKHLPASKCHPAAERPYQNHQRSTLGQMRLEDNRLACQLPSPTRSFRRWL